jgi:hypothetical protein
MPEIQNMNKTNKHTPKASAPADKSAKVKSEEPGEYGASAPATRRAPRGIAAAIDSHATALMRLVVVTKERDELLAAARTAAEWLSRSIRIDDREQAEDLQAAIAKVERSKP